MLSFLQLPVKFVQLYKFQYENIIICNSMFYCFHVIVVMLAITFQAVSDASNVDYCDFFSYSIGISQFAFYLLLFSTVRYSLRCLIWNYASTILCFSQKLQLRAEVADVFLAKFQLRPEEVQILRGTRDGILHPVRACYPYQLYQF